MNYQTTALWFYQPFYYLAFLICLGFTFLGLSSPLFYMVMVGLVLPVLVSMRVHTLSEAGNAWLVKERSDWQVYVNGIPVQEQRSALTNPCFSSPIRLKQFYLRAFICKLIIQVIALIMLWTQGREAELMSITALAEVGNPKHHLGRRIPLASGIFCQQTESTACIGQTVLADLTLQS